MLLLPNKSQPDHRSQDCGKFLDDRQTNRRCFNGKSGVCVVQVRHVKAKVIESAKIRKEVVMIAIEQVFLTVNVELQHHVGKGNDVAGDSIGVVSLTLERVALGQVVTRDCRDKVSHRSDRVTCDFVLDTIHRYTNFWVIALDQRVDEQADAVHALVCKIVFEVSRHLCFGLHILTLSFH